TGPDLRRAEGVDATLGAPGCPEPVRSITGPRRPPCRSRNPAVRARVGHDDLARPPGPAGAALGLRPPPAPTTRGARDRRTRPLRRAPRVVHRVHRRPPRHLLRRRHWPELGELVLPRARRRVVVRLHRTTPAVPVPRDRVRPFDSL